MIDPLVEASIRLRAAAIVYGEAQAECDVLDVRLKALARLCEAAEAYCEAYEKEIGWEERMVAECFEPVSPRPRLEVVR